MIYFDHNSITDIDSDVLSMLHNYSNAYENPSSIHKYGQDAKIILEAARRRILDSLSLNHRQYNLIFTSGATEANNIALMSAKKNNMKIISPTTEHKSVVDFTNNNGVTIPVCNNGLVDINALDYELKSAYTLGIKCFVSIMYANNETGVLQDFIQIKKLTQKYDAVLHSDIVQAFAKVPVLLEKDGIELASISGGKIGALQGIGALIYNRNFALHGIFAGGEQEFGIRAGTQNMYGIKSLHIVSEKIDSKIKEMQKTIELRNYLEKQIKIISGDRFININQKTKYDDCDVFILCENVERVPNTTCIGIMGLKNDIQTSFFDINNIAVGAGAACSSGTLGDHHVPTAMGLNKKESESILRISLSHTNSIEHINFFIEKWKDMYYRYKDEFYSKLH